MPEHRIRLRGGWECVSSAEGEGGPEVVRRLDLPAPTALALPRRFRLTRQFGRPPVDPRVEDVWLELGNVGGLRSARLNGRTIPLEGGDTGVLSVPIDGPLLPRNGLVLEVVREDLPADGGPWGEVALVIRGRAPGG